jgi:hypothetical protein
VAEVFAEEVAVLELLCACIATASDNSRIVRCIIDRDNILVMPARGAVVKVAKAESV